MAAVPLAHTIQAMLHVGGDFLELGDPIGIHSLRVLVQKRKAAYVIQTNTDEAMSSKEPRHVPSISNDMLRASLDTFLRLHALLPRTFQRDRRRPRTRPPRQAGPWSTLVVAG